MDRLYKAQTRFLFHAHIKIKISAFFDNAVFDELFSLLEDIDRKYNSYQSGSFIDQINRYSGSFVDVDNVTVEILSQVIELSNVIGGAYDITIMPLIRLWGFYKSEGCKVPSRNEIESALRLIDYKRIEIDGNKVRIGKGQEIITGSFLKAYAIDQLRLRMKNMGISDAIINAGGSTIYGMNDEAHPFFGINVRHPDTEGLMFEMEVSNECYSTSSQAKTFVDVGGQKYGHILNALTGYPSLNKQLGLVSENCMLGDIVSTGLFNESTESFVEKMKRLSCLYDLKGYLMDADGVVTYSDHFTNKIVSK